MIFLQLSLMTVVFFHTPCFSWLIHVTYQICQVFTSPKCFGGLPGGAGPGAGLPGERPGPAGLTAGL
jgi:hypothetical protein